jgi:type III pantothenate kinase
MFAIDCGNTRIKWARFDDGAARAGGSAALDDTRQAIEALGAALGQARQGGGNSERGGSSGRAADWERAGEHERVLVANVAGPALADAIAAAVRARHREPEFVRVQPQAYGLECGYHDPATLGVDRWLAMLAGRRLLAGAFAVVSAGTAVTFDAVDAAGHHLGGLILPGDRLMLESLTTNTRQIGAVAPAVERPATDALLGRTTAEAVAHGARLAVAAAVDRARGIAQTRLGGAVALLLTGGDADRLAPWLESKATVRADLVLEGLAIVAGGAG